MKKRRTNKLWKIRASLFAVCMALSLTAGGAWVAGTVYAAETTGITEGYAENDASENNIENCTSESEHIGGSVSGNDLEAGAGNTPDGNEANPCDDTPIYTKKEK